MRVWKAVLLGSLMFVSSAQAGTKRVYRIYNPQARYHVYTTEPGEMLILTRDIGLRDEGVGFLSYSDGGDGRRPLHRLYNPNNGQHYYTLSDGERDILVRLGWHYEKDEGFLYPASRSGTREIYNLYDTRNGDHLYPTSMNEVNALLQTGFFQKHTSIGYGPGEALPRRSPNFGNPTGTSDSSRPIPYASSGCTPTFPYKDGWFGADSTFSYPTSSTRSIWTFQDTFFGGTSRQDSPMIGNSVAIGECVNGRWSISYYSRGGRAFFDLGEGDHKRLWPFHPFMSEGKLYYPAAVIVAQGGGFGLEGIRLIRIDNPKSPPNQWSIRYLPLSNGEANVGCGSVIYGGHVYLYGCRDNQLSLSRMALSGLGSRDNPAAYLETLRPGGVWARGYSWNAATKLPIAANGGLSPRYNEQLGKWQMLYFDTKTLYFAVRSAASPAGPWSAPVNVYFPAENRRPGVICYAAYEQVVFERDLRNEIAFTYTCNNLASFEELKRDTSIYLPRTVRLRNPL